MKNKSLLFDTKLGQYRCVYEHFAHIITYLLNMGQISEWLRMQTNITLVMEKCNWSASTAELQEFT